MDARAAPGNKINNYVTNLVMYDFLSLTFVPHFQTEFISRHQHLNTDLEKSQPCVTQEGKTLS
jgi:hypothetical protein